MRVLVVDDDVSSVRLVMSVLARAQHEVTGAYALDEAAALLSSGPAFQVLLVDKQLGPDSGLEFARRMRQSRPELAIIVMTADPRVAQQLPGVEHDGYLEKPFRSLAALREIIDIAAQRRRMAYQRAALRARLETSTPLRLDRHL